MMVIDKMMGVIDSVTAESIDSEECDGSDGKIKKSDEKGKKLDIEIESNTINQGQESKNDSVEEF